MYSFTPSPHGGLSSQLLLVSEQYSSMALLFACLLITVLSIPLLHMLTALAAILLRCVLLFMQRQSRAHFTWRPGSLFLAEDDDVRGGCPGGRAPAAAADAWPDVVKYEPTAADVDPVECVFCLSDIEVGEEVRELRCRHLFHRRCLDKWLVHRAAACPLCRDALVPPEAQTKRGEAEDDEDVVDPSMILVAYVHNGWWVW